MIIPVATASDPRLAPYAAVKDRDLARRDGRFIVEGRVTLQRLIEASRFQVESLFLSETRIKPLASLLWKLDPHIPVYTTAQSVMDGVTGFHLHRGVLAIARRGAEVACEELIASLSAPQLTLLALVGLSNHDNVGACFRNAAAFGADGVVLDETSCDPLYRKSIRVSAGTALSLPFARSGDGAAMLAALKTASITTWALTPSGGKPLSRLTLPPRLAVVVGAEGPGLSSELMDGMVRVSIPMVDGVDSLNVAAAGAIALSHVFSKRIAG